MDEECIDDLKKKYKYNINANYKQYDIIFVNLSIKCYSGICNLIEKIEELIQKLKGYKGSKSEDAQKYLIKMMEKLNYYNILRIKLREDMVYYTKLIRNIIAELEIHLKIQNLEEICLRILKEILNSKVQQYIKFDKYIINLLNLIQHINILFYF